MVSEPNASHREKVDQIHNIVIRVKIICTLIPLQGIDNFANMDNIMIRVLSSAGIVMGHALVFEATENLAISVQKIKCSI